MSLPDAPKPTKKDMIAAFQWVAKELNGERNGDQIYELLSASRHIRWMVFSYNQANPSCYIPPLL